MLRLLMFVSSGPVINKSTLVRVIAWDGKGNMPLPEPAKIQSVEIYISREIWTILTFDFSLLRTNSLVTAMDGWSS